MKARDLLSRSGPFLGLVGGCVLFGFLIGPGFFRPANLDLITRQTAIVGIAALGMTLVIAAAGIDLSVGSTVALSTIVIALLLRSQVSPAVAALAAVGPGALCGLLTALPITQLNLVPFLVTLGRVLPVRGAARGLAPTQPSQSPQPSPNHPLPPP